MPRQDRCRLQPRARLLLTLGAALAATLYAARAEDGADLVKDLHAAFGDHHARAVHAKGVVLEGSFVPTKEASELSKASVFASGPVPVTVRFSDFTGIPDIPDNIGAANPRGFAIKFRPADGSALDLVTHSFNGFPTATADEFGELLRAVSASGPNAAKPTALDRFLDTHPVARIFLTTQKSPESYATAAYFGVNAFDFVDASGNKTVVRYRLIPSTGEHYLDAAALKEKGPDFLREDIAARVGKSPIRFDWLAQIAQTGDRIENPSIAWPETRELVKLGTIEIDRLAANEPTADKALLFMPGSPPEGIEPADPMLQIRDEAYTVSFGERQ